VPSEFLPNEFGALKFRHQPLDKASSMSSFRTLFSNERKVAQSKERQRFSADALFALKEQELSMLLLLSLPTPLLPFQPTPQKRQGH